jgi:hypothetical protein
LLSDGGAVRDLAGRGAASRFGKHRLRRFEDAPLDAGTAALPYATVGGVCAGLIVHRQKA